jgi:hypothetical protein
LFLSQFSRRSCLCLACRPRKPRKFGPNVSPSANDPMLPSRSSASRSAAGLCLHRVESYSAIFGGDGLEVRRTRRSKRKLAAAPQAIAFLRVQTSDSTKDSIEIKLPEAGQRLEAIGVREQPLTTHHLPLPHMSPSGRLDVLGVRLSSAAYARRQFLCRPPD